MSGRYENYKGSSRSTRDDSRLYKTGDKRRHSRTRSRSPRRHSPGSQSRRKHSPSPNLSYTNDRHRQDSEVKKDDRKLPNEWDSSDEEVPAPPPPPRITKISMGFSKPKAPIKMNIGTVTKAATPKPTVANVFKDDDDDEPEEMPAEARMRMRNIGRETPTSAGPNSFGKTKQGFCDVKKVFEKNLKQAMETTEKPTGSKFPQTIYKIKGP